MIIQERFVPLDEKGGYYVTDRDKTIHITYDQARKKSFFLDAITNMSSPNYRGDIGKFCYEHEIGLYFDSQESFAYWIGAESHYDEDNVFYIDGFPGRDGEFSDKKSVAFQLRVSNHPTIHFQWEKSHARPSGIRTEFCLNLYINPEGRKNETPKPSIEYAITDVNCDISDYYRGMPEDRKAKIDEIINRIKTNGAHIAWDEILFICGEKKPKITTTYPNGVQHREENFGERTVDKKIRRNFSLIDKEDDNKPSPSQIPDFIPYSVIDGKKDGEEFEYEGRTYKLEITDDDMVVYPIRIKHGIKYTNKSKPISIQENRLKIKINRSDIVEMVVRVVKNLLP